MYEIQIKTDMLAGTSLVVTMPECEIDKKALLTISETQPRFVLPLQKRNVDGNIELTFKIGSLCKLKHITGFYTAKEYIGLWINILSPLMECGDWFMKSQSFVFDIDYLFCDKDSKVISYIYIPSIRDYSCFFDLKDMAAKLARQITVEDAILENKVLRAIMDDFSPKAMLAMLRQYVQESETSVGAEIQNTPQKNLSTDLPNERISSQETIRNTNNADENKIELAECFNEIVINVPENNAFPKAQKNLKTPTKEKSKRKQKGNFFRKTKKVSSKDNADLSAKQKEVKNQSAFIAEKLSDVTGSQTSTSSHIVSAVYDEATEYISTVDSSCGFKLVGSALLPNEIKVSIEDGEIFTIGRYDATVGSKQSNFEFERNTKAISRRHAAIERHLNNYSLIDLSSNTGTFVDGLKIPPGTPVALHSGAKVSFGCAGADYIWDA